MNGLPLPQPPFDDGRGRYPETIAAAVPLGLPALLKSRAAEEGISAAEFVRRAVADRLRDHAPPETVGAAYMRG